MNERTDIQRRYRDLAVLLEKISEKLEKQIYDLNRNQNETRLQIEVKLAEIQSELKNLHQKVQKLNLIVLEGAGSEESLKSMVNQLEKKVFSEVSEKPSGAIKPKNDVTEFITSTRFWFILLSTGAALIAALAEFNKVAPEPLDPIYEEFLEFRERENQNIQGIQPPNLFPGNGIID